MCMHDESSSPTVYPLPTKSTKSAQSVTDGTFSAVRAFRAVTLFSLRAWSCAFSRAALFVAWLGKV